MTQTEGFAIIADALAVSGMFDACKSLERYRSGHNEAVLKTVWRQRHMGSNPILSAGFDQESQKMKKWIGQDSDTWRSTQDG